jgi:hypothetical protein
VSNRAVKEAITRMNNKNLTDRIKEMQTSMVETAKSCFDESELGHLRAVIRISVEFHEYMEHGSTETARRLKQNTHMEHINDLKISSEDPFNKYDLRYMCESIRSGIDSFCSLNQTYRILDGAMGSKVDWSMASSRETFKAQFMRMFNGFVEEDRFENKCRLLLDLFKLQMLFSAMLYE